MHIHYQNSGLAAVLASIAMLPDICIVVPTYWTRAGGEPRQGDAVYDHPTPLDGESTLPRLLQSLNGLKGVPFYLMVLVASTGEDVAEPAEEKVRAMIKKSMEYPSVVFGRSHLPWLYQWMNGRALDTATQYLSLRGYPAIRNLQLALPHALHSKAIIALDDDEIVADPDFVEKASAPLGATLDGHTIEGLSGHYLNDNDSIYLRVDPDKERSPNIFDRKAVIMNEATRKLEGEPGDIVETPFCFGGNMEFSPDLVANVGFDPGITRGEDIDYLINARIEGKRFFLRKDLTIVHRPPKGGSYRDATASKLQQDVLRFIYEREKLVASQHIPGLEAVTPEDLAPYPGDFLKSDITYYAVQALQGVGEVEAEAFVKKAVEEARGKVSSYLGFRQRWPALMQAMYDEAAFRERLLSIAQGV